MKQPILVTGIHRSGSTWIGKTISASKDVKYIHEPFNIIMDWANPLGKIGLKTRVSPFNYWFEYFDEQTSEKRKREVLTFIRNFYELNSLTIAHELFKIRGRKDISIFCNEIKSRAKRPLLKDPIAFFSSAFLAKELNCKVIISIRHPLAFIASIIRKSWEFNFNDLLEQERLMELHLSKYKDMIINYSNTNYPLIDQGILLWNIMYDFAYQLKLNNNSNFYFITHEAMSKSPFLEFENMFKFLDLNFSNEVIQQIERSTSGQVKNDLNRNALQNIKSWKSVLTNDEVQKIKEGTEAVASKFYTNDSWI
ncbi:sulfotransferase domain-containing protein [Formosa sp. S-31]|uniref:sulfotransferase domain-containing protein n=1 Tax=Formosa sp. S-31 TaxID=2790949 RepID=UPI003EB7EAA0